MLFSSIEFIFGFLPVVTIVYFALAKRYGSLTRIWLLVASLFFYGWWNPSNIFLILGSMVFNYFVGKAIAHSRNRWQLILGIAANLGVLFYYKYVDFFLSNVNSLAGTDIALLHIVLPLGISFFTFQQIAYLVDNFEGMVRDYKFHEYGLFVSFFPQLVAGPIVHHSELMPQFENKSNRLIDYNNLAKGLFIFNCGLAKKIIVADTFSVIVNNGYGNIEFLSTLGAWVTSLAYSIQLYFDFSGYSDMAIGLGLIFNIQIPVNFNSPYRAKDIQDFWRRWHITLSRFLRDYLYIPLGGNRRSEVITSRNLLVTFVLGGIWHGAGWTFVFWGFMHGAALVIYRYFSKVKIMLPKWIAIAITFTFVNITWVFFRSPSWHAATEMIRKMVIFSGGDSQFALVNDYYSFPIWIGAVILLFSKNTNELAAEFSFSRSTYIKFIILLVLNILFLNSISNQEFLYFDF